MGRAAFGVGDVELKVAFVRNALDIGHADGRDASVLDQLDVEHSRVVCIRPGVVHLLAAAIAAARNKTGRDVHRGPYANGFRQVGVVEVDFRSVEHIQGQIPRGLADSNSIIRFRIQGQRHWGGVVHGEVDFRPRDVPSDGARSIDGHVVHFACGGACVGQAGCSFKVAHPVRAFADVVVRRICERQGHLGQGVELELIVVQVARGARAVVERQFESHHRGLSHRPLRGIEGHVRHHIHVIGGIRGYRVVVAVASKRRPRVRQRREVEGRVDHGVVHGDGHFVV